MIDFKKWEDKKITIDSPLYGEIRLNTLIPLEWQLVELWCDCCDMEIDCRKCEAFEYSLLYQLINN